MFGTFRLILAVAVASEHAGVEVLGFQQGVAAVVCFYILSGFVMAALLHAHYPGLTGRTPLFYVDRALRILPQYVGFMALTLICVVGLPIANDRIRPGDLNLGVLLANLTIVPLNYYMLADIPRLIPPGWSLGAEVQFYVLAPILVHVRGVRWPALTIAVAVLVLALAGVLDSDIFGYRVMPGILLFFVSGVLLYEARRHVLVARRVVIGLALVAGIGGLGLWLTHHMPWLGHEIIGGYLLGLSGVSILARLRPHRLDDLIGGAAYGTFLAHWLVIWLLGRFAIFTDNPGLAQVAVVVGAVALGVTGYLLFERPVTSIRHRLRRRASRSASPAVSVVTSKREPEGVPA